MKKINTIVTLIMYISINSVLCQNSENKYEKFIENGVEFQTNGIDTICIVEPMPEYPGGMTKMIEYLGKNIIYPKKARKDNIEGRVLLRFSVDKSGELRDFEIIQSVRKDIDKEAMRVAKKMPKWKPGEQNGNPVSVSYVLPIKFSLN